MGIKASPTAVLQYGDQGGAIGYRLGEENHGLEYMFIMMNAARFTVGVQGIALSEAAYQKALHYAKERLQGRTLQDPRAPEPVPIIEHPDVKRMLMMQKALTEGMRALAYVGAAACDIAQHHPDENTRRETFFFYDYLVPIIKGFSTEMSVEVTSLGIQVYGGMGFIEETGIAQHYRDARILPIYEGTTAIQANDLIGRKTLRDGGKTAKAICQKISLTENELQQQGDAQSIEMAESLKTSRLALESAIDFVLAHITSDPETVFTGSVLYLKLAGIVLCGWQLARALLISKTKFEADEKIYSAKISTALFYAQHVLAQAPGLLTSITCGSKISTSNF